MPHAIDVMVGERIRLRRHKLSMSMVELGKRLGLTFQQVQKYENAANRVSCSRLYELSEALGVPIMYFFSDAPQAKHKGAAVSEAERDDMKEGIRLMKAYRRIKDHGVRRGVLTLVESLAASVILSKTDR